MGRADTSGMDGFSNAVVAVLLDTVSGIAGERGLAAVLEAAGERRPLSELRDPDACSTLDQVLALGRAAVAVTGVPDVVRMAGERAVTSAPANPVAALLATLGEPGEALLFTADHFDVRCTAADLSCEAVRPDGGTVTVARRDLATGDRLICEYMAGMLAALPTLFRRPPGTVTEVACQTTGAPRCRFEVSWDSEPQVAAAADQAHGRPHAEDGMLGALLRLGADCMDPSDGGVVAHRLAATASSVCGGGRTVVLRWVEEDDRLVEAARSGGGQPSVAAPIGVTACGRFVDRLAARGRPLRLGARHTEPVVDDLCRLVGFDHGLVLPLLAHGTCYGVLLTDSEPSPPERLRAVADVAAAALARLVLGDRVSRQAMLDPLTGLADRALLQVLTEPVLAQAERAGSGGALVVVDVEGLGAGNEGLGRAAGDRVLAAAAERLRSCVRAGDTVARVGDGQFAVLLPTTRPSGVAEVVDRLLAACAVPVTVEGGHVRMRMRLGVATCAAGDSFDDLWARAEHALRQAKVSDPGAARHPA